MAWYWSDDVARAAIEAGFAAEPLLKEWIDRPVAFAAEAGLDAADVAVGLLGIESSATVGAA